VSHLPLLRRSPGGSLPRRCAVAGAGLLLAALAACDGPTPVTCDPDVDAAGCGLTAAAAAHVELAAAPDSLYPADTLRLAATVRNASGVVTHQTVQWSTSDASVATVGADGLVTAVPFGAGGLVTITAASGTASASVSFRVRTRPGVVAVSERVAVGRSVPLALLYWNASGSPTAGANVAWTSSDTTVLAPRADGTALAKRAGTALLRARTPQGGDSAVIRVVPGYTVTYLGTLGGTYSRALDVNDAGQVVGNSTTAAGDTVAFLWENGSIRGPGAFRLPEGSALIDAAGHVVGTADLPPPAGGRVTAVDDQGRVAGYWTTGDSAFVERNGSLVTLARSLGGPCRLYQPVPLGRNRGGDVVGLASISHPECNSFVEIVRSGTAWTAGGSATFLAGVNTGRSTAVNDAGTYTWTAGCKPSSCGRSSTAGVFAGGAFHPIYGFWPLADVWAWDLNEAEDVVGEMAFDPFSPSAARAFLRSRGAAAGHSLPVGAGLTDLSFATAAASWTILSATGINESGQIVGVGLNAATGQRGAVLLTPQP
jgi:probable HAF family extracellular repeat protein